MALTEEEKIAKENLERSNKITVLYRKHEALKELLIEQKAQHVGGVKNTSEIDNKVKNAKKELDNYSLELKNSKDKKLVSEYNDYLESEPDIKNTINSELPTYTMEELDEKTNSNAKNDDILRLPTEEELDKMSSTMTSKEKLRTLDEDIYKQKDIRIREFKPQKDRFEQLVRKSSNEGLTKSEYQEANKILQKSKKVYEGGADFKRMDGTFRNKIAYPYLRDEFEFNKLQLSQTIANKKAMLDTSNEEERKVLEKEISNLEDEFLYNFSDESESAQALKELDIDAEKRAKIKPKGASSRDYDDIYDDAFDDEPVSTARFLKSFGNYMTKKEEEKATSKNTTNINDTNNNGDGTGGGGGTTSKTNTETTTGGTTYNDINEVLDVDNELQKQAVSGQTDLTSDEVAKEIFKPQIEEFVATKQEGINPWENVMDIGRMVTAWGDMTQDVPEYERGDMWKEAMADARSMKDMGFTPDEMSLYKNLAERGYAYDVSNIRRLAGGSAGVALGNLGRATSQLYGQYGKMAAEDARLRRQNMQNFQQMASRDEMINRQIFQDDLSNVLREIDSAGMAFTDAMGNIQDRIDYNKQYGPGSLYEKYMNALAKKEWEAGQYTNTLTKRMIWEANNLNNQTTTNKTKETPTVTATKGRVSKIFSEANPEDITTFEDENKYKLGSTGRSTSMDYDKTDEERAEESRKYGYGAYD